MGFLPGRNETTIAGTTPATLVAAPGAATQRMTATLSVFNNDTAAATVILKRVVGSNKYVIDSQTLQPGERLLHRECEVLDATNASITVELAGAITTTALDCVASYADLS